MNANDLIAEYNRLDDFCDGESKRFAEHLKPTKGRMEEIKSILLDLLNREGGKKGSIATDAGTAYKSTIVTPKVIDRDAYLDFVFSEEHWDAHGNAMLQLGAPQKDAVKEYQETHDGQLPPGVKTESFTRVNIKRS